MVFGRLFSTCGGGVADTSSFEDDDSSEAEDSDLEAPPVPVPEKVEVEDLGMELRPQVDRKLLNLD